jgi:hypothetical protein
MSITNGTRSVTIKQYAMQNFTEAEHGVPNTHRMMWHCRGRKKRVDRITDSSSLRSVEEGCEAFQI